MTELETALIAHNWSLEGYLARPVLDNLMRTHADKAEAASLWDQHCPWSVKNGGYINWIKK